MLFMLHSRCSLFMKRKIPFVDVMRFQFVCTVLRFDSCQIYSAIIQFDYLFHLIYRAFLFCRRQPSTNSKQTHARQKKAYSNISRLSSYANSALYVP